MITKSFCLHSIFAVWLCVNIPERDPSIWIILSMLRIVDPSIDVYDDVALLGCSKIELESASNVRSNLKNYLFTFLCRGLVITLACSNRSRWRKIFKSRKKVILLSVGKYTNIREFLPWSGTIICVSTVSTYYNRIGRFAWLRLSKYHLPIQTTLSLVNTTL